MSDKDYYPPGAYNDKNAPYNQPLDPDPIEVTCDTVVSLRKQISIHTDQYITERVEEDGSESVELIGGYADREADVRSQHVPLTELLEELARYIRAELEHADNPRKKELEHMLEDCEGWTEDYFDIEDYEIVR